MAVFTVRFRKACLKHVNALKLICFWWRRVFAATHGPSPVVASGGCFFLVVSRLLTAVASLAADTGSRHAASVAAACGL